MLFRSDAPSHKLIESSVVVSRHDVGWKPTSLCGKAGDRQTRNTNLPNFTLGTHLEAYRTTHSTMPTAESASGMP
jgi:hypothetical protein